MNSTKRKFIVEIDKKACQGFRACIEVCPRLFQFSNVDGKSTIVEAKKVKKENEAVVETLGLDKIECATEAKSIHSKPYIS